MKIAVLVKQVPDTWADRRLDVSTGRVDRQASPPVIDEIGEFAVETALRLVEEHGGTVTAVSMGPPAAADALRRALEMGADEALLVTDEHLVGADLAVTARVLARALEKLAPDLVVTGNKSTDGRSGILPAMIAEHLSFPIMAGLDSVEVAADSAKGSRAVGGGTQQLRAELPAVLSITEQLPDPRMPGLRDVLKARKRPLTRWGLADLGLANLMPLSRVVAATERPPRAAGPRVNFSPDAVTELADLLSARGLI